MNPRLLCLAAAIAFTFVDFPARGAQLRRTTYGPGTQVISPTVEATWIAEGLGSGLDELELLVLWRGAAGWFLRPGSTTNVGGGGGNSPAVTITRGDLHLTFAYDKVRRIATIQSKAIELGTDNVVFVDDVDAPDGPRVIGTMHVERAMPGSAAQIGFVMQKSKEIMSFLRCDAAIPDGLGPGTSAWLAGLCLQNVGTAR